MRTKYKTLLWLIVMIMTLRDCFCFVGFYVIQCFLLFLVQNKRILKVFFRDWTN